MPAHTPPTVFCFSGISLVSSDPAFKFTLNSLSNMSVKVLLIPSVKSSRLSISVTSSSVFFSSSFKDFQTPVNFIFPRLVPNDSVFMLAVSISAEYLVEASLILSSSVSDLSKVVVNLSTFSIFSCRLLLVKPIA